MALNLFNGECDIDSSRDGYIDSSRDGYLWHAARVGDRIGGERIGATLYQLPDHGQTWPYHFHHGVEEWLYVGAALRRCALPTANESVYPGQAREQAVAPRGPAQLSPCRRSRLLGGRMNAAAGGGRSRCGPRARSGHSGGLPHGKLGRCWRRGGSVQPSTSSSPTRASAHTTTSTERGVVGGARRPADAQAARQRGAARSGRRCRLS
jgi:hypothetical protein